MMPAHNLGMEGLGHFRFQYLFRQVYEDREAGTSSGRVPSWEGTRGLRGGVRHAGSITHRDGNNCLRKEDRSPNAFQPT